MMKLITGVPGAGKTLYAMKCLVEEIEKGRDVFTNIDGCCYPGVQPLPDHCDWRELPEGSAVFYDEAHQIFRGNGKPGPATDARITEMDEHRHKGYDLYFITQFPTKVHHEIRSMVDEHCHLLRNFGAPAATLYRWPESANVTDRASRDQADSTSFVYPKKLYQYYKSATIHTSKIRIPAKLKLAGGVALAIMLFVGTRLFDSGGFSSFASAQESPVANPASVVIGGQAAERPADTAAPTSYALGGCVSSNRGCQCYTPEMSPIPMADFECRNIAENPLPTILKIGAK